ncbi:hypothetical protein TCAL_00605 [Tigriopus californicus]|uniref:Large ribosomal subunit protein uL16m n=1 Tax=Tigriopus californicus TaxID=6832 RepID=A0A553PBQ0_TIGCA|nr:large ribosomal subunit protein uL16m-like [Tigriopus californicus]TRY75100.1 hypothetical protein TCAL_00605 [Tigriopus californicus]|eukprot:TCALIF_00605-PA protein Name:"Similar to MRPL16 39S ribosomal protein L16, mitochondrial (Bos taurus)" AED:0.02 eAED:0.06 QI:0/-1/0/1/-1/1/1/0/292
MNAGLSLRLGWRLHTASPSVLSSVIVKQGLHTSEVAGWRASVGPDPWRRHRQRYPVPELPARPENVVIPEKHRLPILPKVPSIYGQTMTRPPKGTRELYRMQGEERVHNKLILEQFGIVALAGGRLTSSHFEFLRNKVNRWLHPERSLAIFRVDAPYQPVTNHGAGRRMGGGKGSISHYVTPVKAGRVIVEVAGDMYWPEVQPWLSKVAEKMPFEAMAVNQDLLERLEAEEKRIAETNENPYTFEWLVRNNIMDCQSHLSPKDRVWFGRFLYRDRTLNRKYQTIHNFRYRMR